MKITEDHRGKFIVSDSKECSLTFVSENTHKFTFRGMHYQTNPYQEKHIYVIQGSILDFTYNLKTKETLSYHLNRDSSVLKVTQDFAHGFLTLEPNTIVVYQAVGEFNPDTYVSIPWHSIEQIKTSVNAIVGNSKIILTDKDNYGNRN